MAASVVVGKAPAAPRSVDKDVDANDTSSAPSSRDLDDTYDIYKQAEDLEADPVEIKKVIRRVDFRVVTILFGTYLLQYLDKNALNFANAYGLQKGTNLHGQDFSWLGKSTSDRIKWSHC